MKQERLFIRVSKNEKAQIRKAAKDLRQSIAAFVLGATYYQLASSAPSRNSARRPKKWKKTTQGDYLKMAESILTSERWGENDPMHEWAVSTLQKAGKTK